MTYRSGLTLLVLLPSLCASCQPQLDSKVYVEEVTLGANVDLESAVYILDDQVYAVGGTSLVGEGGTLWDVGRPLHDVTVISDSPEVTYVVAVGDDGLVGVATYNFGSGLSDFTLESMAVDSDLVAVAGFVPWGELSLIVVADGFIAVGRGEPDNSPLVWTEADAPSGGWGRLRDVRLLDAHVCALGDAGALFCSSLPEVVVWEQIDLDTSENLTRFCEGLGWEAVGTNGTWVGVAGNDFTVWQANRVANVDLVACSSAFSNAAVVVGADQVIYEVLSPSESRPLLELEWQPLAFDSLTGVVLVGEGGRGATLLGVEEY